MDKNEKKLYELMHDQPEGRAEQISECFPPLSDEDKERITNAVMKKLENDSAQDHQEAEITVSGTEMYRRPKWYKYAASAAAMLVAVIGIGSVAFLNRDQGGTPGRQSSQVTTGFTVNTFVASTTAADTTTAASTTTTAAVTDASVSAAAYYSTAPAVSTESVSTSQTTEVSTSTAETTDTTAVTSAIDTDTQTTSAETTEPENVTTTVPAELPFKEGVWIGETSEAGSKRQVTFYANEGGYAGSFFAIEDNPNGVGAPFQCEVEGNTMIFHIFTVEDNTRAEWVAVDEDTVILNWENGTSETLTYDAPLSDE